MENIKDFRRRVSAALSDIDSSILEYNQDEFWMIRLQYEHLEFYAEKNRLFNTAIALPLSRGLHNGVYRKNPIRRSGTMYKPPYIIHCLAVCKMLADIHIPLSPEETDILLASALCHDTIEDIPFPNHGTELYECFHLDKRVYDTVKLVSKRKDFTPEEERAHFRGIMENKLSLLIKLSDRGHNVSDLYNMSDRKIREYINETRVFILPMCEYAREHYPELEAAVEIMQDQIICLTKTTEVLADRQEKRIKELNEELTIVRQEVDVLRSIWADLREEALRK